MQLAHPKVAVDFTQHSPCHWSYRERRSLVERDRPVDEVKHAAYPATIGSLEVPRHAESVYLQRMSHLAILYRLDRIGMGKALRAVD